MNDLYFLGGNLGPDSVSRTIRQGLTVVVFTLKFMKTQLVQDKNEWKPLLSNLLCFYPINTNYN